MSEMEMEVEAKGREEREAVFNSSHRNPQLFLNEVLNIVDDLVDDAFKFYLKQAHETLGVNQGTDKSKELAKGVSTLQGIMQAVIDRRLSAWEKYCLQNCFDIPEGLKLPTSDAAAGVSLLQGLNDTDLDNQLQSLRDKLSELGKESTDLQRQIQALEKGGAVAKSYESLEDILQLYEKNSIRAKIQEMERMATILPTRFQEQYLVKDNEFGNTGNIDTESLSSRLEDLLEVAGLLKNKFPYG